MNTSILLFAQSLGDANTQAMIAALCAAVFIGAVAWLVYGAITGDGEKQLERRLKNIGRRDQSRLSTQMSSVEKFQKLLNNAAENVKDQITPKDAKSMSDVKLELAHAGWRGENAVVQYEFIKLLFLGSGVLIAVTAVAPNMGTAFDAMLYSVLTACIFYYIPKWAVRYRTKQRQEAIFFGLPDALDLMVVCVEAGLGLDSAMRKVCEEMHRTSPIISEEFSICNFQLQMGRLRRDVLHELGQRTGVDDMKSLAAILIQADRFGASIAQALRVQSDAMRTRRRQFAEERAAKTAVLLIFPLVLFIFPAIFVVLVGPAAIMVYKALIEKGF